MPKTKLSQEVESRHKNIIRLIDIPDLPVTLTIERAAEVAGIGYKAIRTLIDNGSIFAIKTGNAKQVIPTWNFIVTMNLFPESLMEKIFMHRLE